MSSCIVAGCAAEAVRDGFCRACWRWAYETLADVRYRTQTPPCPPISPPLPGLLGEQAEQAKLELGT